MAYSAFQNELMSVIATATGTHPKGTSTSDPAQTLFTAVEASRASVVETMKDGLAGSRGRPSPPYVVVQVGKLVHDSEWGARSRTYRSPVSIAIIDALGNTTTTPGQKSIHEIAEAIADAIDNAASFTTFQAPPERAEIDSSETNPVFMALAVDSKVQIVAAVVTWSPGLIIER